MIDFLGWLHYSTAGMLCGWKQYLRCSKSASPIECKCQWCSTGMSIGNSSIIYSAVAITGRAEACLNKVAGSATMQCSIYTLQGYTKIPLYSACVYIM